MRKIAGKNVVITGGSSGLGAAIALEFARQGANVLITYNTHEAEAHDVVGKIKAMGVQTKAIKIAVESGKDREKLVEESYDFFHDRVDILVNNAGMIARGKLIAMPDELVTRLFEVNVLAPIFLIKLFSSKMLKQKPGEDTPQIINMGSISDRATTGNIAAYEGSKAALARYTESSAIELAPHICVNAVAPGLVPTSLNKERQGTTVWTKAVDQIPLLRSGTAKEVAIFTVDIAKHSWMTGTVHVIDGGRAANTSGLSFEPPRSKL